jgi:hypothetical protein
VPISGPGCVEGCIQYPYLDSVARYPKDYVWMYLALVMLVSYVIWMVAIGSTASRERKIFGQLGVAFALMAALVCSSRTSRGRGGPRQPDAWRDEARPANQYNVHRLSSRWRSSATC